MSYENYKIDNYSESLEVTPEGKYVLEIEGQRDYIKHLTIKQAEAWYAKRYPKKSWIRIVKGVNRSWEHKQQKAA